MIQFLLILFILTAVLSLEHPRLSQTTAWVLSRSKSRSSEPKYSPMPKKTQSSSHSIPRSHPNPYKIQPVHVQPDIEAMLKQLEREFDNKLLDKLLDRLEEEFKEMEKKVEETDEALENIENKKEQEPEITESKPDAADTVETDKERLSNETYNKIENNDETENRNGKENTEPKKFEDQIDLDEMLDSEDSLDWLREQTDEAEMPEIEEALGPTMESSLDLLESVLEPTIEQPTQNEITDSTEIGIANIESGIEQLENLEPILDQIEPLEIDGIEPLKETTPLDDVFPEDIEEPLDDEAEVEGL